MAIEKTILHPKGLCEIHFENGVILGITSSNIYAALYQWMKSDGKEHNVSHLPKNILEPMKFG